MMINAQGERRLGKESAEDAVNVSLRHAFAPSLPWVEALPDSIIAAAVL